MRTGYGVPLLAGVIATLAPMVPGLASPAMATTYTVPAPAGGHGVITRYYVQASAPGQITHTLDETLQPGAVVQRSAVADTSTSGVPYSARSELVTSAYYGTLAIAGSGTATVASGNGSTSRAICYFNCEPLVQFFDTAVVQSGTLANGTLVNLALRFDLDTSASFSQTAPDNSGFADAGGIFRIDNQNYSLLPTDALITRGLGSFSVLQSIVARVGDTIWIRGGLYGNGQAASFSGVGPSGFQFAANGRFFITPDAGVSLQTASGHDYRVTAGVPEPASWALLLGGFGLIGVVARRRRQRVVAA